MDIDTPTREQRAQTTCLLILAVLAVGYTMYLLRGIVVPFLVSVVLAYSLSPIVHWFNRRGCRHAVAVAGAFFVAFLLLLLFGGLVTACVRELTLNAEIYLQRLNDHASDPQIGKVLSWLGITTDAETDRLRLVSENAVQEWLRYALRILEGIAGQTFLVMVFVVFIFFGRSTAEPEYRGKLLTEVEARVRRYLLEMTGFSVLTGVLVWAILTVLNVDFALVFGFLAFALNFIPTLGPIAATLLPVPVILLSPEMTTAMKVLAVIMPASVQVIVGNVIQPRFQSKTQGLHPVAAMLSLMLFGLVWGMVGAVLAVPLAGAIKIALEQIPGGGPFAGLLEGDLSVLENPGDENEPSVTAGPAPASEPPADTL